MNKIHNFAKLLPEDYDILMSEFSDFKERVRKLDSDRRYYVYSLCLPDGTPFYVGKGSGTRAYDHLAEHTGTNRSNKLKHAFIEELVNSISEFPIVHIVECGLTETDAYAREDFWVSHWGMLHNGSGILSNKMPGGVVTNVGNVVSSNAGKIGGASTRDRKVGIFSEDYDRSAQSKLTWERGAHDHVNFSEICSKAGKATKDKKAGIFREDLQHLRSEWAKKAALARANKRALQKQLTDSQPKP